MMHGASMGDAGVTVDRLQHDLATIGYRITKSGVFDEQTAAVVRAFQRRWRPALLNSDGDSETVALAHAVAAMSQEVTEP
jgi:N-acetylmuramoyl-L-alanine amidase